MKFLHTLVLSCFLFLPGKEVLAQNVALLLFDSETGENYAGCLNCSRFEETSVCNQFGDYGSKFSDESIWNRFGDYGSRFNINSPWNKFGGGLRIVDTHGVYYGRFSLSPHGRSNIPLVQDILEAYEILEDLDELRDFLCDS